MEPEAVVGYWDFLLLVFEKGIELFGLVGAEFQECTGSSKDSSAET